MISHRGLVAIAYAWRDVDHWSTAIGMFHLFSGMDAEQAVGVAGQLVSGMEVIFLKNRDVQENIREIGPSILFFAPGYGKISTG